MKQPGFITQLLHDLQRVPVDVRARVNSLSGFHEQILLRALLDPKDVSVTTFSSVPDGYVGFCHDEHDHCGQLGSEALDKQKVAYLINACEQKIEPGKPDALARIPKLSMSLLTLKLFQAVGNGPVWIATTPSFLKDIKQHVLSHVGIDFNRVHFFEVNEAYQLSPDNRLIFNGEDVSLHGCGMGDLLTRLSDEPTYREFIEKGGKHVFAVDSNNVFASLDPVIIGNHIESKKKVTCEVVKRKQSEEGSVVVEAFEGIRLVDMRRIFETSTNDYTWMCTNSYVFDTDIDVDRISAEWCRTQVKQHNNVLIRYQKFFDELTKNYDTNYIGVDRQERFLQINDSADVAALEKIVNIDL
jgi:hypothetical protein